MRSKTKTKRATVILVLGFPDRLGRLATKPRGTVFSDEAQSIIADVEQILNLVSRNMKSTGTRGTKKRKRDLVDRDSAKVFAEASRAFQQRLDIIRMHG